MNVYMIWDEISVLSRFIADNEEKGELAPPISDIIIPVIKERIKELLKLECDIKWD